MAGATTERAEAIATGCPMDRVLGFLAQAWMADVIYALAGGPLHFGAFDDLLRILDAELRLITAAKSELDRGRPHLATAWLDDHARRFPGGVFATDREALRVLVSCSQSRNLALAEAFAARHPGSAMVERLLRACGKLEPASPKASSSDFPK